MEIKDLTEEQKAKLKKLHWSFMKNSVWIGLKCSSLLILADAAIIVLNALYVQNNTFAFVGGCINAFFILSYMGRESRKERDRVDEEAKKILQP